MKLVKINKVIKNEFYIEEIKLTVNVGGRRKLVARLAATQDGGFTPIGSLKWAELSEQHHTESLALFEEVWKQHRDEFWAGKMPLVGKRAIAVGFDALLFTAVFYHGGHKLISACISEGTWNFVIKTGDFEQEADMASIPLEDYVSATDLPAVIAKLSLEAERLMDEAYGSNH